MVVAQVEQRLPGEGETVVVEVIQPQPYQLHQVNRYHYTSVVVVAQVRAILPVVVAQVAVILAFIEALQPLVSAQVAQVAVEAATPPVGMVALVALVVERLE